jgi:Leucine-rich repeat (LRR) protein
MAQSPEALAKYHFIEAQNAYGNGDNNTALTNLQSCVEALTKTNSKIEALYTYIFLNKKEYLKAKKHMTLYFDIASEDHSDYMKMTALSTTNNSNFKEAERKELERIQEQKLTKEREKQKEIQIEKLAKEREEKEIQIEKLEKEREEKEQQARVKLKPYWDKAQKENTEDAYLAFKKQTENEDINPFLNSANQKIKKIEDNKKWEIERMIQLTGYADPKIIRRLSLRRSELEGNTSPPEYIGELSNLTFLHIGNAGLTNLPESIGKLTNLVELYLLLNHLKSLPESIGQLTNLAKLDLSSNDLKSLPESIGQLTKLTKLDLLSNKLTRLPESIGRLMNLTELDLRGNKLTCLPESIGKLTNLTKLYLIGNKLTSLPESIGRLMNLTELDLRGNKLTSLPESIGMLTNLRELTLDKSSKKVLKYTVKIIKQRNQNLKVEYK